MKRSRRQIIRPARSLLAYPRVVGEPCIVEPIYIRSHIQRHADWMRKHPTPAERALANILNSLNSGVLKRRFSRQHVISGKWIVDFFFPEIRLAIEVDGSFHRGEEQRLKDQMKEVDCSRFDITLLRVTNREVFGDREQLVDKLRAGWRAALRRENKLIGKPVSPGGEISSEVTVPRHGAEQTINRD